MTTGATFGQTPFGQAALGDPRRTRCLARIADRIGRPPGGTLPAKLHRPKDDRARGRLMNRPEATHAAAPCRSCATPPSWATRGGGPAPTWGPSAAA